MKLDSLVEKIKDLKEIEFLLDTGVAHSSVIIDINTPRAARASKATGAGLYYYHAMIAASNGLTTLPPTPG